MGGRGANCIFLKDSIPGSERASIILCQLKGKHINIVQSASSGTALFVPRLSYNYSSTLGDYGLKDYLSSLRCTLTQDDSFGHRIKIDVSDIFLRPKLPSLMGTSMKLTA